jgi:hypothetical protein
MSGGATWREGCERGAWRSGGRGLNRERVARKLHEDDSRRFRNPQIHLWGSRIYGKILGWPREHRAAFLRDGAKYPGWYHSVKSVVKIGDSSEGMERSPLQTGWPCFERDVPK